MGKSNAKRNLNFRETQSERSATASYRNFGKFTNKIQRFKSFGRGK